MTIGAGPQERTGVLVLRAWIEHECADGFRARITSKVPLAGGRERVSVAADPQAVLAAVEHWMAEMSTSDES